jgi:hypothetical protein
MRIEKQPLCQLDDLAREIEGQIQAQNALLDRLIIDGDREILRLQDLLTRVSTDDQAPSKSDVSIVRLTARQPDATISFSAPNKSERKRAA